MFLLIVTKKTFCCWFFTFWKKAMFQTSFIFFGTILHNLVSFSGLPVVTHNLFSDVYPVFLRSDDNAYHLYTCLWQLTKQVIPYKSLACTNLFILSPSNHTWNRVNFSLKVNSFLYFLSTLTGKLKWEKTLYFVLGNTEYWKYSSIFQNIISKLQWVVRHPKLPKS